MDSIDSYTRQCIKVSVAQICQVIGWTSIQSTPLEILTDLLQEYMMSLARMTNNYATHYGMNSPGVQHVGLSLKTIGVSFNELAEYMAAVEAPPAYEVPLYPVRRESHLNLLKPGSREVVTRPVHIHEHLPPVHPHLQDEDAKESLSIDTAVSTEVPSPTPSPKGIFKKPGDPDNILRKQRIPSLPEEEVRALREITSVMMTTSGFLSPAREGKLPEARTPASSQGTMTSSPTQTEKQETPFVLTPKDRKKKKAKENKTKDKDTTTEADKPSTNKGSKDKPKLPKVNNKVVDRSPSPNPKNTFVSGSINNSLTVKSAQRKQQSASPVPAQNSPVKTSRSPMSEKTVKVDNQCDEIKLPSELDKQKLNIFKKISKVKDELEVDIEIKEEEKWSGLDEIIDAVSRGTIEIKEEVEPIAVPIKEEPELQIDVVSVPHKNENFEEPAPPPVDVIRPPECKKRKKDKHKDRYEGRLAVQDHGTNTTNELDHKTLVKPLLVAIEEQMAKSNLPVPPPNDLPIHQSSTSLPPFPYYPFPSGVLSHPLIPQGPPVLVSFPPLTPGTMETPAVAQPRSTPSPQPVLSAPSPIMGPPAAIPSTSVVSSPKKKEHKKIKKLKDKLKKKKGKKEKNKAKIKSEKKRLKLEKKEREKEKVKSKKEKKEKKKEKEPVEEKLETQNVPKITLKLSPVSPQDSPETCHRKIVIKPVVKKDEDKVDTSWTYSATKQTQPSITTSNITKSKPHRSQKSFRNSSHATGSANPKDEGPKVVPPSVVHTIQHNVPVVSRIEAQSDHIYICPACNRPDDGSPMIACDSCDVWIHWICVGIQEAPESDWFCRKCTLRMDEMSSEKRKKHKRKKAAS